MLALQGAFARHLEAIEELGHRARAVRTVADLDQVERLIIPGGESTTINMLLDINGLRDPIQDRLESGMPAFGTCAGMIVLADTVLDGRADQVPMKRAGVTVRRNGYGRQLASFESALDIAVLDGAVFPGIFIRAPIVTEVGPETEVLAELDSVAVLCRRGPVLVASFHPELSADRRLHEFFCSID